MSRNEILPVRVGVTHFSEYLKSVQDGALEADVYIFLRCFVFSPFSPSALSLLDSQWLFGFRALG